MKTIERFEYQLNRETGEKEIITKKYNVRVKLRKRIKTFLIITLFILIGIAIILQLKKLDDDFMESCQNAGYSYNYCLAHK